MGKGMKAGKKPKSKSQGGFGGGNMQKQLQQAPAMQRQMEQPQAELEETEFNNIMSELEELEVLSDDDTIPLDGEDYLIYKLEKDCHVTTSIPANKFTEEFFKNELKKIEDALD